MITIQPEKEEDYTAIHEINVLAFGRENEARLVKKIREDLKAAGVEVTAMKNFI